MQIVLILSTLIISAYCQQYPIVSTDTNCGKGTPLYSEAERIVGGTVAAKGTFGWNVIINDNGRIICSGSIVNSSWIVTSGYCLYGRKASTLQIDIGVHDRSQWDSYSVAKRVSKFFVNTNYVNNGQFRNDIAMLKLDSPIILDTFTYKVVPVCIPSGLEKYESRYGYVSGYGSTYSGGDSQRYLTRVSLPVLTDARCKQKFSSYGIDTYTQVCAGESFGNADFCEYDNGSPLVVRSNMDGRWHLVGIASFGYNPCGNGGVYTRVSAFTSFILDTMKYN